MSDTLVTTLFRSIFQVTVIYHDGLMEHEQKGAFLSCTDPAFRAGKLKNEVLVGTTRLEQHQQLPDEFSPGGKLSSGRTSCSLMAPSCSRRLPEGSSFGHLGHTGSLEQICNIAAETYPRKI